MQFALLQDTFNSLLHLRWRLFRDRHICCNCHPVLLQLASPGLAMIASHGPSHSLMARGFHVSSVAPTCQRMRVRDCTLHNALSAFTSRLCTDVSRDCEGNSYMTGSLTFFWLPRLNYRQSSTHRDTLDANAFVVHVHADQDHNTPSLPQLKAKFEARSSITVGPRNWTIAPSLLSWQHLVDNRLYLHCNGR